MEIQQEFFILGLTRPMQLVDDKVIRHIPNMKEALRLCINLSGFTTKQIAEKLGIDKGHMSRIMSDQAHFNDNLIPDLMALCGNYAPLQFLAHKTGFKLTKENSKEKEIRELKERLEALEKTA